MEEKIIKKKKSCPINSLLRVYLVDSLFDNLIIDKKQYLYTTYNEKRLSFILLYTKIYNFDYLKFGDII